MNNSERVAHLVELLKQAESAKLDGLECPDCHDSSVSVWFTHPAKDEYRTWLVCSSCSFHERAHNSEMPAFFSESRVDQQLQRRDAETLGAAIFKRPRGGY